MGKRINTLNTASSPANDDYLPIDGATNGTRKISADFVNNLITDVEVDGTSVVTSGVAEIDLSGKQDTLTAGSNIQIAQDGTISATDTTYIAGTNVQIDNGVISATDTTYTAGTGIDITNGVISSNVTPGSTVSVTQKTSTGTNIADITVDGVTTQLYAPNGGGGGSSVIPNPAGTATDTLSTIEIDGTIYSIEGRGSGGGTTIEEIYKNIAGTIPDAINLTKPINDFDIILITGFRSNTPTWKISSFYVSSAINQGDVIELNDDAYYAWYTVTDLSTLTKNVVEYDIIDTIYGLKLGSGGSGGGSYLSTIINDGTAVSNVLSLSNPYTDFDELLFTWSYDNNLYITTLKLDTNNININDTITLDDYSTRDMVLTVTSTTAFTITSQEDPYMYILSIRGLKYSTTAKEKQRDVLWTTGTWTMTHPITDYDEIIFKWGGTHSTSFIPSDIMTYQSFIVMNPTTNNFMWFDVTDASNFTVHQDNVLTITSVEGVVYTKNEPTVFAEELTQSEYDALPDEEKNNGCIYMVSSQASTLEELTEAQTNTSTAVTASSYNYDTHFNQYHYPWCAFNRVSPNPNEMAYPTPGVTTQTCWTPNVSQDGSNSWICYHFDRAYKMTSMTINSFTDYDSSATKSMVIEGSNDGTTWTNILLTGNSFSLDSYLHTLTPNNVNLNSDTAYEYVRLRSLEPMGASYQPSVFIDEIFVYGYKSEKALKKIYYMGTEYGNTGGGSSAEEITLFEYNELTTEEKNDGTIRFIPKSNIGYSLDIDFTNSTAIKESGMSGTTVNNNSVQIIWDIVDSYCGLTIYPTVKVDVTNYDFISYDFTSTNSYDSLNPGYENPVRDLGVGLRATAPSTMTLAPNMDYTVWNRYSVTDVGTTFTDERIDVSNLTGEYYLIIACAGWNATVSNIVIGTEGGNPSQIKYMSKTYAEASGALAMKLTQAEYDVLTQEEKENGTIYFVATTTSQLIPRVSETDSAITSSGKTRYNGGENWHAFDGIENTSGIANCWVADEDNTSAYIQYHFSQPYYLTQLQLKLYSHYSEAWTGTLNVLGSNDGSNWTNISSTGQAVNVTAPLNEINTEVIDLNSNNAWDYIRVQANGTAFNIAYQPCCDFSEIYVYGSSTPILVEDHDIYYMGDKYTNNSGGGVVMTGATSSVNGTQGEAPQPLAGDQEKVLTGAGTWTSLDNIGTSQIYLGDLIPRVTSSDTHITASSEGTYGSTIWSAWGALTTDISIQNVPESNSAWVNANGDSTPWIMYYFDESRYFTEVEIKAFSNYGSDFSGTIYIEASNDASAWTDIGGGAKTINAALSTLTTNTYSISNNNCWRYIRIRGIQSFFELSEPACFFQSLQVKGGKAGGGIVQYIDFSSLSSQQVEDLQNKISGGSRTYLGQLISRVSAADYKITASTSNSNYPAWGAFNGTSPSNLSNPEANSCWLPEANLTNQYIQYHFDAPRYFTKINICCFSNYSTNWVGDIKIEGSSDGSIWENILASGDSTYELTADYQSMTNVEINLDDTDLWEYIRVTFVDEMSIAYQPSCFIDEIYVYGGTSGEGNTKLESTELLSSTISTGGTYTLEDALENYDFVTIVSGASNEEDIRTVAVEDILNTLSDGITVNLIGAADRWVNITACSGTSITIAMNAPYIHSIKGYKLVGGGGSSSHTYSTTEQKVGTWIDGSDVYEKSINIDETTRHGDNQWTVNLVTDVERVISTDLWLSDEGLNGGAWLELSNREQISNIQYGSRVELKNNILSVLINGSLSTSHIIGVIRYTKVSAS